MRVAIVFAAAATSMCAALPASAVVLQEFGGTASPGEGQISNYFTAIQHERFNGPNLVTGGPCAPRAGLIQEDSAANAGETEGFADYLQGSVTNRYLAPSGSDGTNCYGYVNADDPFGVPSATPVDGMFLFGLPIGTLYLGFYWGSPDIYNYFRAYDGNYNRLNFTGPGGENWGDTLDGAELIAAGGVEAPNSVYVNFLFDFTEDASFIGFGSTNWAFEFDNVVTDDSSPYAITEIRSGDSNLVGIDPTQVVPAPGALGLFGLGVIALSGARRRFSLLN